MKILLYAGDRHVGGDPEEDEARAVTAILRTCFLPARGHILAWLFFDTPTGCGRAIARGPFVLKPGARELLWDNQVGCELVPTALHHVLVDFGPADLRWNGTELVVNGQ